MSDRLVLASCSQIRQDLLRNAGLDFDVKPARIDEDSIRKSMLSDGAPPRDIADALAEQKARRGSQRDPEALVLGCDQVLSFKELGKAARAPGQSRPISERWTISAISTCIVQPNTSS